MQLTKEQVALLGLPEGSVVTLDIKEPPKPWQPSLRGKFFIDRDLVVKEIHPYYTNEVKNVYNLFESEDYANLCVLALKKQLKLMQWLSENKDAAPKECTIVQLVSGDYSYIIDSLRSRPFVLHMSEGQAKKLCKLLNEGLYEM
jgi:hypothetical protein